jgi:hypothetical protein
LKFEVEWFALLAMLAERDNRFGTLIPARKGTTRMSELHSIRPRRKRKILKPITQEQVQQNIVEGKDGQILNLQHLLISMMLPASVKAFFDELESEVEALCGQRYGRSGSVSRYGSQAGSVILGN